jgi:tetratricopeptide (TPR) repeat protein
LAIFPRKKGEETKPGAEEPGRGAEGGGSPNGEVLHQSPEKAAKFFDRARTVHETGNYEYAMTLWLDGLRQDPFSMSGLDSFFKSCAAFLAEGNKSPGRDTVKQFSGRGDLDRYLYSLLAWGMKPRDPVAAVRATEAAAKLKLTEATYWLGERALVPILEDKKPRKDLLVKMIEVFASVGAFDKAVFAGEAAVRLDPSDGKLAAEVRNLAAQMTMSAGGYEQAGEAGGFRANIRDLEKQRRLEEGERIVKTEETIDRLVKDAEEDYRTRPEDPPAVFLYAKRLGERGRPEDLKKAREVLNKGFEATRQFRFREMAGDLLLRQAYQKLSQYREAAEKAPADEKAKDLYRRARAEYTRMEIAEFQLRVENYPTDNGLKFELGKRYFETGDVDKAIPLFQKAQHDAKRRVEAMFYLAQSFQKIDYTDEAINTYRNALEAYRVATDETGMALRYGLMTALQTKAEAERELAAAEEADKLASAISIQQFDYKDIRTRRDALKKLIGELKRGDAA